LSRPPIFGGSTNPKFRKEAILADSAAPVTALPPLLQAMAGVPNVIPMTAAVTARPPIFIMFPIVCCT
jgi:hypothetical protein